VAVAVMVTVVGAGRPESLGGSAPRCRPVESQAICACLQNFSLSDQPDTCMNQCYQRDLVQLGIDASRVVCMIGNVLCDVQSIEQPNILDD
jgi:hypothetical protein